MAEPVLLEKRKTDRKKGDKERNRRRQMSVHDETWDRPICEFCGKEAPYGKKGDHLNKKCIKDAMEEVTIPKEELKVWLDHISAEPAVPYSSDRVLMLQDAYKVRGDTLFYLNHRIRAYLNIN